MKYYDITGMSCAACSARVEKAVSKVEGVTECSVSLLTNSMAVDGMANDKDIVLAVEKAGYGAVVKSSSGAFGADLSVDLPPGSSNCSQINTASHDLTDRETPKIKKRLISSLIFWIILMYFSMGHMMWNFPLPPFISDNHVAMGLIQLLLTTIIMIINQKFFISGFKSLLKGAPNMDTLVALGSGAAFVYSVCMLFLMTDSVLNGNSELTMKYMDELYFESAGTILTLITIGKMLEARSKGKTTDALKELMKLAPSTAHLLVDGVEKEVAIQNVRIGDIFVVRPGESIPVDGIILEGISAVDESALSGESIPVDKDIDDSVSAATINKSGFLKCRATRVGTDTTFSQIIKMVSDASATKAPIAKTADKVSGIFVPTVIGISLLTFIIWLITKNDVGFALTKAIAVLVISCPCALGLATPVAIMVGSGVGARNGLLFKTAASLEGVAKVNTVVLDKTGTITTGFPAITDIISEDPDLLLKYAGGLESKSEHPLSRAVIEYLNQNNIQPEAVSDFKINPGNGLSGRIADKNIYGGNLRYIKNHITITVDIEKDIQRLAKEGKTPLLFAYDSKLLGIIAVSDTLKPEGKAAVEQLKNMGVNVLMLTGDNKDTANAIASRIGIEHVIAEVLPDGKDSVITQLLSEPGANVAMVGDGINDAPALTRANIGIAIGAGTDVAIDAADIVLVKSTLSDVAAAIRLGRSTLRNIRQNLFWAFIYNIIGIPLAAGLWYPLFGIELNPMFGAAAMSLSSFCVVTNALRLNLVKIHNANHDKKIKNVNHLDLNNIIKLKENETMEKKMTITGMMCGHCEARVKKVLESLPEVTEAIVSHTNGTAVVKLSADIDSNKLSEIVTNEGYEVTSVE